MTDRILGVALFLPVPIVLWLFTRAPFGPLLSLAVGTAVMATHRLYTRPFALARAGRRCLWCGGTARGALVEVDEPFGRTQWRTCSAPHHARLLGTLATAERHRTALKFGILGGLAGFLLLALAAASGVFPAFEFADAVACFKLVVALTVLPFGWLAARGPRPERGPLRVPFPLHIQALVGTVAVLWLFRLVGLLWLAQVVLHLARRLS